MKKSKLLTTAVALGTAAALALGGTFAWQSINQTALNEASDIVNPGGRLHDDFDGTNKDIYVENFADEPIYARIQLGEYFGIVMNYGTGAETKLDLVGEGDMDSESHKVTVTKYETFNFADRVDESGVVSAAKDAEGNSYWNWTTGGSTVYMPTFNLNKDSLVADINGIYEEGNIGTISNRNGAIDPQYTGYTDWATYAGMNGTVGVGANKTGTEIYDGDVNNIDEVKNDFDNLENYAANIVTKENMEHIAAKTGEATLISMADWKALENKDAAYWVYDTDGWVYYSKAIAPHTATGLLLDGIELSGVMDDTWYYAINVTAQFVTANDVGKADNTGFYDTTNGSVPSTDAEALLKEIGVEISDEGGGADPNPGGDEPAPAVVYTIKDSSKAQYFTEMESGKSAVSYNMMLNADGEAYSGEGTVTWTMESVYGGISDADNTKINANTGAITIGDELTDVTETYKIFKITASIDGTPVVSRNIPVVAYKSYSDEPYGQENRVGTMFKFYKDGVEVASDQLVTGATYTIKSFVAFLGYNVKNDENMTGTDLTAYIAAVPTAEIPNLSAIHNREESDCLTGDQFAPTEAGRYEIGVSSEQYDIDYEVFHIVEVADGSTST